MDMTTVAQRWMAYKARPVNMTIHPDDVMYNTAVRKPDDYQYCGESGIQVISSVLAVAPTTNVRRILDFGCGHGRVGRYMRALFPEAAMTFADVDGSAVEFCAQTFSGRALKTPEDFSQLSFDEKYDLIWLGSVFTHMDYARMQILFDKLFGALDHAGVVIGTFRGEKMYQTYKNSPAVAERDADLLKEYEATGVAYKRYPGWTSDWGLSLIKPQKLMELGQRNPKARMVSYAEVAWASAHDVVAWTNVSPMTQIR